MSDRYIGTDVASPSVGEVNTRIAARKMKPDAGMAMRQLIAEARAQIPFSSVEAQHCTGDCSACQRKLLEVLETELDDWERRLGHGERPSLKDLSDLARVCREAHRLLARLSGA